MDAVAKNWKNIHNEIRTGYVIETVAIHSTCGQQIPGIKHWQDKNSVVFCCSTCEFDNQNQFTLVLTNNVVTEEVENGEFVELAGA